LAVDDEAIGHTTNNISASQMKALFLSFRRIRLRVGMEGRPRAVAPPRELVANNGRYAPGTIVISTEERSAVGYLRTEVNPVYAARSCGEGDAPVGTCQAEPAAPSSAIKRRRSADCAPLRRMKRAVPSRWHRR
jgi:hypothetical protein